MAGPETDSAKPKPEAAKTSAAGGGDATKYVGTSKAAAAGGLATVGPEPSEINKKRRRLVWVTVTGFLGAWFIAFFKFFLPRTLFEPPTIFKIGYASDYALGVDTNGSRSTASGWIAPRVVCSSFTLAARIWAARPIGKPVRTSSSVLATAAATTAKVSTSKGPRRGPWIARTWNWLPMARSLWIPPGCISGPRDNRANSMIREHFCQRNHAPAVGAGFVYT